MGLERVDEFHRIEIFWIGTKEEVISAQKNCMSAICIMLQ